MVRSIVAVLHGFDRDQLDVAKARVNSLIEFYVSVLNSFKLLLNSEAVVMLKHCSHFRAFSRALALFRILALSRPSAFFHRHAKLKIMALMPTLYTNIFVTFYFMTVRCIPACNWTGMCVSQHAIGQGCVYPSMLLGKGCVSQHAIGQGVCIPACNWAKGCDQERVCVTRNQVRCVAGGMCDQGCV